MFDNKFVLNTKIQRKIAHGYLIDGRDWLILLASINDIDFDPKSYSAKKFALLIFSFECNLKSIFVSLSSKRKKVIDIYDEKIMRSHNLEQIYEKCKDLSNRRYRILSRSFEAQIRVIDDLGMKLRYSNDYYNIMNNEPMIARAFKESPSFLVTKHDFIDCCQSECRTLHRNASNIYTRRFKGHEATRGNHLGIIDECMDYIMMPKGLRNSMTKPSDKL